MAYKPRRLGYSSPEEDTVPLKRLTLLDNLPSSLSPYTSEYSVPPYEPEKSSLDGVGPEEPKRRASSDISGLRQTHHRKSWEESWDEAVQVGRWPRVLYASLGILFIVVWFIVTRVPNSSQLALTDVITSDTSSTDQRSSIRTAMSKMKRNPWPCPRPMEG